MRILHMMHGEGEEGMNEMNGRMKGSKRTLEKKKKNWGLTSCLSPCTLHQKLNYSKEEARKAS